MHQAICKEKDNAKGVVIFIHGFLGSPDQFYDWADAVFALGYSVALLLLPGHGGKAETLRNIRESDWREHVEKELAVHCARHQRVILVGHSAGGLLALRMAAESRFPLTGICVIAGPLKLNLLAPHSIRSRIRLLWGRIDTPIKKAYMFANSVAGLSIASVPTLVHTVLEIKKLMRSTRADLPLVTIPVLLVYSRRDETVAFQSMALMRDNLVNAHVTQLLLSSSLHAYYEPNERADITEQMCLFVMHCSNERA